MLRLFIEGSAAMRSAMVDYANVGAMIADSDFDQSTAMRGAIFDTVD